MMASSPATKIALPPDLENVDQGHHLQKSDRIFSTRASHAVELLLELITESL